MPSSRELEQTVMSALTMAGVDAATIERSPGSTVVPRGDRTDTGGRRAFDALARVGEEASATSHGLELHDTIGEGGMGLVRLGTQRALGRQVAVKALKPEHKNRRLTLKMLREAWITGGLEHPNVVPVYDMALEPDGSPLIVLKRIEGDEWASLIGDAGAVRARFGTDDLLEWNLRILMQVCNAVRFAHSRGILHRDLKPENVMIGAFGEVYLVDWGIAVSLQDDGSGRLPLASEAKEMAGTPLYMAPEMLGGRQADLSPRTDVYLLGAILHEIVTGEPPHRGDTLMQLVSSIVLSEPRLTPDVPIGLATIVRRAMDPDPDARFENAEQVRLALQGFLHNRAAERLSERAEERLRELLGLLEEAAGRGPDPELREPIYHLFGQCRFGFLHALEVWPHNDAARESLDRAIGAMVRYELSQGEPEGARALLGEMREVPSELVEEVERARRRRDERDAELKRLQDDLDPTAGRRTRAFLATVVGVIWVVVPLVGGLVDTFGVARYSNRGDLWFSSGLLLFLVASGIWARESMTRTAINRRIGASALFAVALQVVAALLGELTGRTVWETMHASLLLYGGIGGMLAITIDRRLGFAAAGYLAGYVITPALGMTSSLYVLAACNLILLINVMYLWSRPEDLTAAREGIRRRRARRLRWLAQRFGRQ